MIATETTDSRTHLNSALIIAALLSIVAFTLGVAAKPAAASSYHVTTFAGKAAVSGVANGTLAAARFDNPAGIAFGYDGTMYVADTDNHTIRKITPAGVVTTLAGKPGVEGSADGTGAAARFSYPEGIAVTPGGVLYIADSGNQTIRKITPAGVVTTLAGTPGVQGSADGTGAAARFRYPGDIALDVAFNLYVTDVNNHTIRRVTPAGVVSTWAGTAGASGGVNGTGAAARFNSPQGIAVDAGGTLYVTEKFGRRVRTISFARVVSTLAGSGASGSIDGTGTAARFVMPYGIAVDSTGTVFVTDNQTIRTITPAGQVTTVAGKPGVYGSADGTGTAARFFIPYAVDVDSSGDLFVADINNHTVRRVSTSPQYLTLVGSDRYETAILVSKQAYPGGAPAVVLAKGDDFPDALAAAPLAVAYGGPVILTPSWGLTSAVENELKRLDPTTVIFIGLPANVKTELVAVLPTATVKSFVGTDRYHTAALLAAELKTKRGSVVRVVLTAGDKFPDALSVAPLAAKKGWAIILTPQAGPLPDVSRDAIQDLGVTRALIVGTYVQPPAVVTQKVSKVGADRYHTSALVGEYAKLVGLSYAHLAVATGENYPDALVVGPYLAKDGGILLLTMPNGVPATIQAALIINRDEVEHVVFPGLPPAVITTVRVMLK